MTKTGGSLDLKFWSPYSSSWNTVAGIVVDFPGMPPDEWGMFDISLVDPLPNDYIWGIDMVGYDLGALALHV